MARRVFYSFHYKPDNWRAAQVRNMGVIEGNKPVSDNQWEQIKKSGDQAIEDWIDEQLYGKSCTVVLIGEKTAGRKWIKREIKKSWEKGKGLFGIYIHNLKDYKGDQSKKGKNPFEDFNVEFEDKTVKLSSLVKAYDPPYKNSKNVYDYIYNNLQDWVEEAIETRNNY
ncbi:TIR domain-containing protein [Natranaerobius trueperi]|uniref:Thoeris protein ThsB TIR-like domain-containing protein n=1 Tax=Natranaerobius trueperi TaxID=759412 RepID=A0A226BWG4_9FIRM|nr:TIR domain-containing protein [Natranaerobius trueperi]OWZ83378.1 hypothetical protein CDO51_08735 [Natranaerobius trueperi]